MRTACQEGGLGNVGGPSRVRGRGQQRNLLVLAWAGIGEGHSTIEVG